MKSHSITPGAFRVLSAAAALALAAFPLTSKADPAEAADRAFKAAFKYVNMGYFMSPSKEGHGSEGVSLDFEIPVARGLDYTFIVAGDHYCKDIDVYVEAEETENTIVKDVRRNDGGIAGVRWRSDYTGNVTVVVNIVRSSIRCGWCALVGRRNTVSSNEAAANNSDNAAPAGDAAK
jgi:hypothetical protein